MKCSYEKTWVPKKGLFFKPVITFHGNREKLKKNNTSPWFSTPTTFLSRQWISWSDKGLANVILRGPFSGMPGIKKPFPLGKKKKVEKDRKREATVGLGTRRRGSQHAISHTCWRMQISNVWKEQPDSPQLEINRGILIWQCKGLPWLRQQGPPRML